LGDTFKEKTCGDYYLRKDLEREIFKETNRLYYLGNTSIDVEDPSYKFHVLLGGELLTKTKEINEEQFLYQNIMDMNIVSGELWNEEMLIYYANDNSLKNIEGNKIIYDLVRERKAEYLQEYRAVDRGELNTFYKSLLRKRKKQYQALASEERDLFHSLCKKHNYTLETIPGFLVPE